MQLGPPGFQARYSACSREHRFGVGELGLQHPRPFAELLHARLAVGQAPHRRVGGGERRLGLTEARLGRRDEAGARAAQLLDVVLQLLDRTCGADAARRAGDEELDPLGEGPGEIVGVADLDALVADQEGRPEERVVAAGVLADDPGDVAD